MKGYVEFEFDLPGALLQQLTARLDAMESAPLDEGVVTKIPEAQGVYQLLLDGAVVYVGKTDAGAGLRNRLTRHARSIQHRRNLDPAKVMFKAVRVMVFTAMDLETQLIEHYAGAGALAWNNSGFGSNDPGRERDTTRVKPGGFDDRYPIDIDRPVEFERVGAKTAAEILRRLRAALPYILRFELAGQGRLVAHPELEATSVKLPNKPLTTRAVLSAVIAALPRGWQATALPGRVILYRETKKEYPGGLIIG